MTRVAILGSTGSIGTSTLDVIQAMPGRFEVISLSAASRIEQVCDQAKNFGEKRVSVAEGLAHKASHEGIICIEKIKGEKDVYPLDTANIPGCTYSIPQGASGGMTEARAKEVGHEVRVGRFPFMANGKAIALGESEGLIKTVFDAKTGELLGAHMIGAEVTELVQGYGIARTLETTEKELMHTVFPHPTLSEMMHESVLEAYGRAVHF